MLTRARLRWEREDECGRALSPGHRASKALGLEVPKLLHEVGALHQGHVGKVKVTQDLKRDFFLNANFKIIVLSQDLILNHLNLHGIRRFCFEFEILLTHLPINANSVVLSAKKA